MGNIARVGDIAVGICGCCCPSCPHPWVSVFNQGSPDVYTNKRQTMRAPGDTGASTCPHCPVSFSVTGSASVMVNQKPVHRLGDIHIVACGTGIVVSASPDVSAGG